MKFQIVYDFDRNPKEDGWFASPESAFAYVIDGCSAPHCAPEKPPVLFSEYLTGGQMIVKTVRNFFSGLEKHEQLDRAILVANHRIWEFQRFWQNDVVCCDDAGTLASAAFSFIKLDEKTGGFRCIWGADVFTIWLTKAGKIGIVGGDNRQADLLREGTYAYLMALAKGDKVQEEQKKKHYFLKVFPELRRKQDNVEYALLNGQREVEKLWHDFSVDEPIDTVIQLSDGAWIPMEAWGENARHAELFVKILKQDGLEKAVGYSRNLQSESISSKRVAKPEATALMISFD